MKSERVEKLKAQHFAHLHDIENINEKTRLAVITNINKKGQFRNEDVGAVMKKSFGSK